MPKMTLRMKLKASALVLALAALPLSATAAGLGKLTVLSVLGQPLRAELDITASSDELSSLSARLSSADAFKQAGIEYIPALVGIRLSLDKRANGQPFLNVNSDRPINEPFLDLLVELNWASGRLVREYTFLLDPPESLQKPVAAPVQAPVTLPEVKREQPVAAPVQAPSGVQAPQPVPAPVQAPQAVPAPQPEKPASPAMAAKPAQKPRFIVEKQPEKPAPRQEAASRVVNSGDTLSKIAGETKPEGVSLDQMLVALFRSNKDAFDGNNMNRLQAGKILSIPDHEAAAAVSQSEAKQTIVAQSADFNAYRKKLAAAAAEAPAAKEEAPKQSASGKIVPRVEDKVPPVAAGRDKLEVSKSASAKDAKAAAAGAARLAAIEEDLVARDKALKEANSRIAELDKNLNDLKKLVELKNQSLAELEKQAAKPAPAAPAVPEVKKETPKVEAPKVEAPKVEAPKAEVPAVDKAVDKPAEAAPPVAAKPPVPPVPAAAKAPATPAPEASFLADNPEIVYGGGGIIALLLAYLGISRRRRRSPAASPVGAHSETEPTASSVFGSTGGQSVDTSNSALQTDFSQSGMGTIETDEGVDPVAEADVYMAYGRDAQAEEILLDALKADPTRYAIHLKLLEIYAAKKSQKQFESVATDLYAQTGGVGPDWEKAALLIEKFDPEHPLYGSKPAAAAAELAETLVIPPVQEEVPGELEQYAQGDDTQPFSLPGIASPMPEEAPSSLDFDLELEPPEAAAEKPAGEEEGGFSGMETLVIPERESLPAAETAEESEFLDVELQQTDYGVKASDTPATETAASAEEAVAFNFNPTLAEPAGATSAAAEDAAMIELERTDAMASKPLDFSFDFAQEGASPATAAKSVDLSTIDLELDQTSPVAPAAPAAAAAPVTVAAEDVATKLELAHAYEEMGDKEGARELLQEVIQEGNAEQQESARAKLAQLS